MPPVFRILRFILVLTGCLHLCGGHYGVMQMFAWGKMIVDYSAEKGLVEGMKDTFGGERPCELCASIAEAKKSDSTSPENPWKSQLKKLELKNLLSTEQLAASKPRYDDFIPPGYADPRTFSPVFRKSPDTPPPRFS